MLIGQKYIKQGKVILRDVDGSEVELTAQDVIDFAWWITQNFEELETLANCAEPKDVIDEEP